MRNLLIVLAALLGTVFPADAQEKIPYEDIAALESAGTLKDMGAGAYEKTLWRNNKRSEVVDGLKNLPPESPLRSLHDIKRRLLLSQADVTLLDNDSPATEQDNLFIVRLQKLQEMGLYEDALKLYTDNVDSPRDAALAEVGLTLMIHQRGLATACLEEKVIAPDFEGAEFFKTMDAICAFELGQTDVPPGADTSVTLEKSKILQAILADDTARSAAMDKIAFTHMTPLELAILKSEGRIDYTTFDTTPGALKSYPARVLMTFLEDKTLPEPRLLPLQVEMARRGYIPVRKLPAAKEAKQLGVDVNDKKKTDEKAGDDIFWKAMLPLLREEREIVNLTPYGSLLKDAEPRPEGDNLNAAIAVILASGNDLPASWCDKLTAQKDDKAAVYAESLIFLGACPAPAEKSVDNLETAWEAVPIEKNENLWVIMGLFAPPTEEYAKLKETYEKQFPLTAHEDYVMQEGPEEGETPEIQAFRGVGETVLRLLAAVKGETGENINPPALQITVKSLLDERLDSDARQVAQEVLVGILRNNKNN